MSSNLDRYWLFITGFLLLSLIAGGIVLVTRHTGRQPVEIVLSQTASPPYQGDIYVGGAVASPGVYPVSEEDTIASLIRTAAPLPDADLDGIKLLVSHKGETRTAQKINLNRAEAWLLQALPGIGQGKAQAIVDYRNQNGPFRRVEELSSVEGIGASTLDRIRDLINLED